MKFTQCFYVENKIFRFFSFSNAELIHKNKDSIRTENLPYHRPAAAVWKESQVGADGRVHQLPKPQQSGIEHVLAEFLFSVTRFKSSAFCWQVCFGGGEGSFFINCFSWNCQFTTL